MQTRFSATRLADPDIKEAEGILRACVHCGFCTATCPTFVLLGDELDSPRGRIYLIKDMLENDRAAGPAVVRHVDRCLSCLGCMTTCPSGVNYMHLVDHARRHIEETYRRPLGDRCLRAMIAAILPHPRRFRLAMAVARIFRPFAALLPGRLGAMLALVPETRSSRPVPFAAPAEGPRRGRMALLRGCVQPALRPEIDAATIRLLTRHGVEIVGVEDGGCCGALAHHLGRTGDAMAAVKANIAAWDRAIDSGDIDTIVVNAAGCGTMIKDYGFLLRDDAEWAAAAVRISARARDLSEVLADLELKPAVAGKGMTLAYQAPCSLQHGQGIDDKPRDLLVRAGFALAPLAEGHLCCGSAGSYNILQPDLAGRLGARKAAHIDRAGAAAVVSANIGCMTQLEGRLKTPIVHLAEILDWATGGPSPLLTKSWPGGAR